MNDRQAFLHAIIAAPDDDLPRLIYADWLDERGESDRACLIRWGVAEPRRVILVFGPGTSVDRDLPPIWWDRPGLSGNMVRGFVESVSCTLADWLRHGPAVVQEHPITEVRITDREPYNLADYGIVDRLCWLWTSEERWVNPAFLPRSYLPQTVHARLKHARYTNDAYTDRDAAFADLSQACIAWAKDQAPADEEVIGDTIPPINHELVPGDAMTPAVEGV